MGVCAPIENPGDEGTVDWKIRNSWQRFGQGANTIFRDLRVADWNGTTGVWLTALLDQAGFGNRVPGRSNAPGTHPVAGLLRVKRTREQGIGNRDDGPAPCVIPISDRPISDRPIPDGSRGNECLALRRATRIQTGGGPVGTAAGNPKTDRPIDLAGPGREFLSVFVRDVLQPDELPFHLVGRQRTIGMAQRI